MAWTTLVAVPKTQSFNTDRGQYTGINIAAEVSKTIGRGRVKNRNRSDQEFTMKTHTRNAGTLSQGNKTNWH